MDLSDKRKTPSFSSFVGSNCQNGYQFPPSLFGLLLRFSIWEQQEPTDLCIFDQLSIFTLYLDRVIPRAETQQTSQFRRLNHELKTDPRLCPHYPAFFCHFLPGKSTVVAVSCDFT
jgi:hypothetical protein